MPSLIDRLRKKKSKEVVTTQPQNNRVADGIERPPEFKLFRQGTQDDEPQAVDVNNDALSNLHLAQSTSSNEASPLHETNSTTPLSSHRANPAEAPNNTSSEETGSPSSPRSTEKSTKRRTLSSIIRRPSQLSSRSRSSSYIPEFQPIDRNGDVEAQWEQRATMLARAGPPSPAIPRSDTIFDTGPPRLPPVETVTQPHLDPTSPAKSVRSVSAPTEQAASSPGRASLRRTESSRPGRSRDISNAAIAEDGTFTHEGQSRDDFLQSAIREHERGNLASSAQLFKKAAQGEEGLPMGQLMYGLSLRHGWGVQRDEDRAIHWLRLAASSSAAVEESALSAGMGGGGQMKGDLILAIFELGNCFRHGWGVPVDRELARNYYETAANLGDSDAMYEVAWCYETGFGIGKEKYKAAYWYRKAETHGSKVPGMQWIWKPKYDHDPFVLTRDELKEATSAEKKKKKKKKKERS